MIPGLQLHESWIDADQECALLAAVDAAPWATDLARRVQHYGFRYDYQARNIDATMRLGPLPSWAMALAQRAHREGFVERVPDQVIVNEYLPGQGIARHVDRLSCFGPTVLSLSLGSACAMDLHAPAGGGRTTITLPPRSLLVLAGDARTRWAHAIPARKSDLINGTRVPRGRRVSVTPMCQGSCRLLSPAVRPVEHRRF